MAQFAAHFRLALYLVLAGVCGVSSFTQAWEQEKHAYISVVSISNLPAEAAQTLNRIRQGGPFPYLHKDGSIFGNFERRLPSKERGYYREYTVPTPGRNDRGARRIVAGKGASGSVSTSGEYYYTGDHYRTFRRIREP